MLRFIMAALAFFFVIGSFSAGFADNKPAANLSAKSVTLVPPYISTQTGELTYQISVQSAIVAVAEQAGLRYDWKSSLNNTVPILMQFIQPDIRNQSWQEALEGPINIYIWPRLVIEGRYQKRLLKNSVMRLLRR
jgi:hypothetical protein